jgi:two-component system, NarL family, response regulator YdfI
VRPCNWKSRWEIALAAKSTKMPRQEASGGLRVLVAAASAVRRAALEGVVRSASGLTLAGSVTSLAALRAQFRELHPDILVVDLDSPHSQFLNDVRALPSPAAIVALLPEPEVTWSALALRAGVRAILEREAQPEEIVAAIHAAHLGTITLDPELALDLASHVRADSPDAPAHAAGDLTAREIEVLRMLAEGLGNKQIASRLGVTDHTIKFHISSILGKLGASTRTEAVTMGIRMGLIAL